MSRSTNATINDAIKAIKGLVGDNLEAVKDGMDYYGKNLLDRHFKRGSIQAYGYPPLTPEYRKLKREKVGNKQILNYTGALRRKVLKKVRAKIIGEKVVLRLKFPQYGFYQLDAGRNFISPNRRDIKDIMKHMRKQMGKIRKRNPYARRYVRM